MGGGDMAVVESKDSARVIKPICDIIRGFADFHGAAVEGHIPRAADGRMAPWPACLIRDLPF